MSRQASWRASLSLASLFALGLCASACARTAAEAPLAESSVAQTALDRKLVKTASQSVVVEALQSARARVDAIALGVGGYVEEASATKNESAWMRCRVPAASLDRVLDEIAALGRETHRTISATDVTDAYSDDEARLRTQVALRERLTTLLARAKNVEEVLAIEKELARLQTEIETLERRLEGMRSQIAFSTLHVSLERKRILGPLGYVGKGLWSGLGKLFVIR